MEEMLDAMGIGDILSSYFHDFFVDSMFIGIKDVMNYWWKNDEDLKFECYKQ